MRLCAFVVLIILNPSCSSTIKAREADIQGLERARKEVEAKLTRTIEQQEKEIQDLSWKVEQAQKELRELQQEHRKCAPAIAAKQAEIDSGLR
jgi:peptidoglycan hydrolase CwlO-like protein